MVQACGRPQPKPSRNPSALQGDVCGEAIRLGRLARELMGPEPPAERTGLAALMLRTMYGARRSIAAAWDPQETRLRPTPELSLWRLMRASGVFWIAGRAKCTRWRIDGLIRLRRPKAGGSQSGIHSARRKLR